jgi:hypothetical protein
MMEVFFYSSYLFVIMMFHFICFLLFDIIIGFIMYLSTYLRNLDLLILALLLFSNCCQIFPYICELRNLILAIIILINLFFGELHLLALIYYYLLYILHDLKMCLMDLKIILKYLLIIHHCYMCQLKLNLKFI